ncbi:chymotrypsin-like [Wyeomyia smithii]|uniref:chymotrypsin-like n=1 Tax=Wyeomyia smithii TaxID=174621 RepID=UPI0024680CE5|nr:chymotrypsin-like [Wyeomyia smithii]
MKTQMVLIGLLAVVAAVEAAKLQCPTTEDPANGIIYGKKAKPHQFPYQALVVSYLGNGYDKTCGGSVLTENYILTAAHCLQNSGSVVTSGKVILGAYNKDDQEEETQQRIKFGSINIHPHASGLRNDIATIRLEKPAVFDDYVQPVILPEASDDRTFAGMTGIASSFGRLSEIVRYTSNVIMTNADGSSELSNNDLKAQYLWFCIAGDVAVCHGDSGSPLVVKDGDRNLQAGISLTVTNEGCGTIHPTRFIRVSHYLAWIVENSDVPVEGK